MFRYFLSWRYLVSRRTNLIAIVGLFLAVGALVMILSIMTGFLQEHRDFLRGSMSDVIVTPIFLTRPDGTPVRDDLPELLGVVREDERVRAATARLSYYGLLERPGFAKSGLRAEAGGGILARTAMVTLAGVQLTGIDVLTAERIALATLGARYAPAGIRFPTGVQDELDTSELLPALTKESRGGQPVPEPLFPFGVGPGAPPGVVVGEQLFAALGLERGQPLEILTAQPDERSGDVVQRRRTFTVAGSFRSGENESDLTRIYMARTDLADFVGGDRPYSQVVVDLRDYDRDAAAVCADLTQALVARGLLYGATRRPEIETWEQQREIVLASIENQRSLMAVMLSLILMVAGFTVFAILSMMITEKRRDIGILTALGATPGNLVSLFLMIAAWDVVLGALTGAAAGALAAVNIDAIERWLSGLFGVEILDRNLYGFDTIPSQVEPVTVAVILAGTLLLTLLFAVLPAWRASRLDPLQAIRQS